MPKSILARRHLVMWTCNRNEDKCRKDYKWKKINFYFKLIVMLYQCMQRMGKSVSIKWVELYSKDPFNDISNDS
jgi:hypothetical protein